MGTVNSMWKRCFPVSIILLLVVAINAQFEVGKECFCKEGDAIASCKCYNCSIDVFNNNWVFPILRNLLQRDFFKFYKVNMERPCPFWDHNRECGSKECGIGYCDDEVPVALRNGGRTPFSSPEVDDDPTLLAGDRGEKEVCDGNTGNEFDPIDRSLSEQDRLQLHKMDIFEEGDDSKFCDVEDEDSTDTHYVNLLKNPERYTGYKGDSAVKVWRSIYQENCFKPDPKFDKNFLMQPTSNGMCLEKRIFYRLISGLHTAITITIAANSYKPPNGPFGQGTWFRNVDMFVGRFSTKWSKEGPERLRNLYFVYLLELRAIIKLAPYLQKEIFYTGNEKEDLATRQSVDQLMNVLKEIPDQFDETQCFTGENAGWLREEFRQHFLNISRIMDCVDCDKCRLWGKLQTHGMGTALKILFSDLPNSRTAPRPVERIFVAAVGNGTLATDAPTTAKSAAPPFTPPFKLTRNDVVALFQSFGRYASSIWEVDEFRREIFHTNVLAGDRYEL